MTLSLQDKFDQINDHARGVLPDLLREWFPRGRMISKTEYGVANLNGDEGESLSINIRTGRWKEFAGGPGGYEPLGLYAHAFCGGDRKKAFKELRAKFGLSDDPAPTRTKGRPHLKVVPKDPPDDFKSMVPPPDNVGKPTPKDPPTEWHEYRGAGGVVLRYVGRYEHSNGKKEFAPWTYGTSKDGTKWHKRHPNEPLCLYGLDVRAARPNARVLLQEGERKTDDVGRALGDGWACMAWSGGANMVSKHDFSPLAGAAVVVSGDAVDGEKAALDAADMAHKLGATVWTLDLTGFPKGWDLGNAVTGVMVKKGEIVWKSETGPWTPDQIEAFIKDRSRLYDPNPGGVDELADEPDEDGDGPAAWGGDRDGIIPLGFDGNVYYYLPKKGGQVVALTPNGHSELQLRSMASESYWNGRERFQKRDGGVNWKQAAGYFMRACQSLPIYTPDRLRGVGAWIDGDRCVLHKGEHLIVDGRFHPGLMLTGKHSFVYERKASLNMTVAPPINTADANKLAEIVKGMRWENPLFGTLMAGWIAVAPICGALKWRPAIWVTGGSGAGKTTLDTNIVSPILNGICERMASSSTEAGIRQILKNNALPIIFDEAEAEGMTDKQRIQHVLDLVRASTQEGGAAIVKGTQSQTGAIRYTMRSCFMFMSVNVTINRQADESRITVLSLENAAKGDVMAQAHYDRLMERIAATITPEYCAGFVARSVLLMTVIRDNAEVFKRAVAAKLGSSRVGDQIGTLCAGAYSLHSPNRITLEEAREWVDRQDWEDATSADAATDEQRLVDKLLSRSVTVKSIATGTVERTVGELLRAAAGQDDNMPAGPADDALKRCGIMFHRDGLEGGMYVANQHPALADYLKDTPWSSPQSWRRALKRYPGAQSSATENPGPLYFAGVYSRAIFVPVRLPDPPA